MATADDTKIPLTSPDVNAERVARLRELFPEAFTEGKLDPEKLARLLGDGVTDAAERYGLSGRGNPPAATLVARCVANFSPIPFPNHPTMARLPRRVSSNPTICCGFLVDIAYRLWHQTYIMADKRIFVEQRPEGDYAVRKPGADRASAVEPTQAKAIEKARELNPGVAPHVERVRQTDVGGRDKWRKP